MSEKKNQTIVVPSETDSSGVAVAQAPQKKHRVEWNDVAVDIVGARDSIEAWAYFCDGMKPSPSPKAGKVDGKRVGYESDEKK